MRSTPCLQLIRTAVLASVLAAAAAIPADAQIRGYILDRSNGAGISAARITIFDAVGDSLSLSVADAEGAFTVAWPGGAGSYTLRVQALGYEGTSQPIDYRGEPIVVDIRVAPAPVELEGLEIEVEPISAYLDRSGFYRRSRRGTGQFLNLDGADRPIFSRTADIFRRILGVVVETGGEPYVRRAQGTTFRQVRCYPVLVLDDFIVRTARDVEDNELLAFDFLMPPPLEIAAIEVYSGSALAPPQWRSLENDCGVIAIWTKR